MVSSLLPWECRLRRVRCAQERVVPVAARRDDSHRASCTDRETHRRAHCAVRAARKRFARQPRVHAGALLRAKRDHARPPSQLDVGEQAPAAVRALFKARDQLIGEGLAQGFELIGSQLLSRSVHLIPTSASRLQLLRRCAEGRHQGRAGCHRQPTRKSHSMRTPSFSSGMYTPGSMVKTMPGFSTAGYCAGSCTSMPTMCPRPCSQYLPSGWPCRSLP